MGRNLNAKEEHVDETMAVFVALSASSRDRSMNCRTEFGLAAQQQHNDQDIDDNRKDKENNEDE